MAALRRIIKCIVLVLLEGVILVVLVAHKLYIGKMIQRPSCFQCIDIILLINL